MVKTLFINKIKRLLFSALIISFGCLLTTSCEPLATSFDDTEGATCYTSGSISAVPDTFTVVRVMTWNIRFGAARILWFGDACGDRVNLTTDEVYNTLEAIAEKIINNAQMALIQGTVFEIAVKNSKPLKKVINKNARK